MKGVWKNAGKLILYCLMFSVICFLLSTVLFSDILIMRIIMYVILFGCAYLMVYSDGVTRGEHGVTRRVLMERRMADGHMPGDQEYADAYDPKKAFLSAAIAALFFILILTSVYALNIESVDSAVTGLFVKGQIPDGAKVITAGDFGDMAIRALFVPYVSLVVMIVGEIGSSALIGVLIPCACAIPATYYIGYLQGPRYYDKKIKEIQEGSRKKRRNLRVNKKPRKPREQKPEV